LGLSKKEIDERFDDIVAFADIGDFIEQPAKTYSSGMAVRLAFAVIAHVDADILVVDEALSVGDAYFKQKCMRYLRNFMKTGTVLFVSHDTGAVVNFCNNAILLSHGQVIETGTPKEIIKHYLATLCETDDEEILIDELPAVVSNPEDLTAYRDMRETMINASTLRNDIEIFEFDPDQADFGTGKAKILSVRLLDNNAIPLSWVVGGEDVIMEIKCLAKADILRPIIGFQLKDRLGQVVFCDNTYLVYQNTRLFVDAGTEIVARFEFRLPLLPTGDYSVSPAIAEGTQDEHVQHQWLHDALIIRVHASSVCMGIVGLPMRKISLEVI
jgi:lipopolysaccharide transport system ATP-binding protein